MIQFSMLQTYGKVLYFHHITADKGLPHNTINSIVKDKYGFIWLATMEGLSRYDGYKIVTYYADNTDKSLVMNRPLKLYKDKNDDIWVAFSTAKQVCKYNYLTDDFSRYDFSQLDTSLQNELQREKKSELFYYSKDKRFKWHISNNALVQTNNETGETYTYSSNPSEKGGLPDAYVNSIYLDNTDILWVGTDNGGVHYADVNRPDFEHYSFGAGNSIRAICVDNKDVIWVGVRNSGVIRANRNNSTFSTFNFNDFNKKQVKKIFEDSNGDIWIGTRDGIYQYDSKTTKIRHFTTDSNPSIPHNWIYGINEDANGILWIGTWDGLASYNLSTGIIYTHKIENVNTVRCIAIGKNGGLWIATEKGLVFLDYKVKNGTPSDFRATHYSHSENQNSINNDFLYSVDTDDAGNVWIGTAKGLCMYNVENAEFVNFPDIEFISDAGIRGVLCYKENVWISYGRGLTRLNRKTFAVRHYDKLDGLQNNEFSEDAYFKNVKKGELFFGGNNGINAFSPDNITDNPYRPQVVFTDLRVQNKSVAVNQVINGDIILASPLLVSKNLEFTHQQKDFEIEFSALHFSNPAKNRYAYKLDGFDKEWIYLNSSRRSAIYSGLAAGKYVLRVKASNCDGLWSEPIELKINILPPWWASGFALTAYVLFFFLILYFVVRNVIARKNMMHRIQLQQLETEKAEEISNIRTTFFTGISHELRTPVTLIIDPLRKLMENKNESADTQKTYGLMYRNAIRLLNLINQLLDFRKVESAVQELHPRKQNIVVFIQNIVAMFEFTASKRNISLKFDYPENDRYFVFDENVLDKIVVNLVSNAFKYSSDNSEIMIRLLAEDVAENLLAKTNIGAANIITDSYIGIQVIDSGMGIASDVKDKIFDLFFRVEDNRNLGSGIGLALTKELVQLHKGYITVESELNEGSCFTVFLPNDLHPTSDKMEQSVDKSSDEQIIDFVQTDELSESEDEKKEHSEKPILLIVEDNDDIREYLNDAFKAEYNVYTSVNGKEGWKKALETVPDLIVSDVMMPIMSGFELCEKLKTDERTSHIPVILLTARQSDEARIEGYETGADDYISKPFNSNLLKIRIKNLIESRKNLRTLFGSATAIELKKISVNPTDEKFINRAVEIVNQHLSDTDFSPAFFAEEMAVSRAQLFRKIKAMTNQTVQEFIQTIKLNHAAELLLTSELQIGDVSIECGFSDASNFRRSFVKKFGVTPSEFKKSNQ